MRTTVCLLLLLLVGCGQSKIDKVILSDMDDRIETIKKMPYFEKNEFKFVGEVEIHQLYDLSLKERFKQASSSRQQGVDPAYEVLVPAKLNAYDMTTGKYRWIDGAIGYLYDRGGNVVGTTERHNGDPTMVPPGLPMEPWAESVNRQAMQDQQKAPSMVWQKE